MKRTFPYKRASHLAHKALGALLILAFLMASLPKVALADTSTCAQKYTVVSGDTLSKIADQYKVTLQEIAAANNLKDPYVLIVGQTLCIPGTVTSTTGSTTSSSSNKPDFTVSRSPRGISIKTANFPSRSVYIVKVSRGSLRDHRWTKVGRVRLGKAGGSVERIIKLPKEIINNQIITVCLKNAITNAQMCKRVNIGPR